MKLYWLAWFALGFGVPETIAVLRHRPQDTLSDTVWQLEGHGATLAEVLIGTVLFILFLHLTFKFFR